MKSIRKNSKKRRDSRKNNKIYNKRKTIGRKYNNNNKNRLTKRKGGMPPPLTRTVVGDYGDYDPVKELQRTKDEYSKFLVKKRAEDEKKGIFNIVKVQKPKELCQWAEKCSADTWRNKEKKEEHFEKYTHSPEEAEISQLLYNLVTYKVNRNERNLNAYDAEIKHFIELCYDLYIKNRPDFPRWMYSLISEYFQFHSEYAFDDYKDTHRLHFYLLASILKNIDYYATTYPIMSFWGLFLHSLFEENAVTGIYPVPGKEPLSNTSLYFYIEKAIPKV